MHSVCLNGGFSKRYLQSAAESGSTGTHMATSSMKRPTMGTSKVIDTHNPVRHFALTAEEIRLSTFILLHVLRARLMVPHPQLYCIHSHG